MPSYFYVKDDGTATGSDGTFGALQSGSFGDDWGSGGSGADYYPSIEYAIESASPQPANGDFIICSSAHDHNYNATTTIDHGSPSKPHFLTVVSVSDSAAGTYLDGATERVGGTTNDLTYNDSNIVMFGLTLELTGFLKGPLAQDGFLRLVNCTVNYTHAANTEYGLNIPAESTIECYDTTLAFDNDEAALISTSRGGTFRMYGGAVTGLTSGLLDMEDIGTGLIAHFVGVDLSAVTGYLVESRGASDQRDLLYLRFDKCQLNASLTDYTEEDWDHTHNQIYVTQCTDDGDVAEYQYYYKGWGGDVISDATAYRTADSLLRESSTKVSLKAVSTAKTSLLHPFEFRMTPGWQELSGSNKKIRIYFSSNTASLDNADIWAEAIYQDSSDKSLYNCVSCGDVYNNTVTVKPLATGSAYSTESGTWTSGGSNLYYMDINTGSKSGSDCVPEIIISIGTASLTIYIDPEVELAA